MLVELDRLTVLPAPVRRLSAPFGVSCTELPAVRYFGSLEVEGQVVAPFATQSGASFKIVRSRFLRVMQLEAAWSVVATLYDDHDNTGRTIVCGEEILSGLEAWYGALDSDVPCFSQGMQLDVVAARIRRARTSEPAVRWMRPDQVSGRTLEWVEADRDENWLPQTKLGGYSLSGRP